ncbi:hypothetical protein EGW08_017205 [Elysia chlorotica]|uniref:Uncharacterized protein n=1 Tax=Elysia chlorotica TaxID=188477 RepID=A0A433T0F8_ELYCH|nr:hypothetical protein EGW08_017205 [Elysia chlorotica]
MASWVNYARKILTSIAGELEQTAQEFNDAIHSLSTPKTCDLAEAGVPDSDVSDMISMSTACSPVPGSIEAGSIPEHLRGVSSHDAGSVSSRDTNRFPNTCSSRATGHSRHTHLPRGHHLPSGSNSDGRISLPRNHSLLQVQLDRALSSTATTRQPEPFRSSSNHPFQSIHNRLSRSSPSLSPVCHDHAGAASPGCEDSSVEDFDYISCDICENDPVRLRTINPRSSTEDQLQSLPFSVSTPCLVHMQKILPSCAKKLTCPSTFSKHVYSAKSTLKPNCLPSDLELNRQKSGDITTCIHNLGGTGNSKSCSPQMGCKRPGKVVMVISQPHSYKEASKVTKEKLDLVSGFSPSCEENDTCVKVSDGHFASPGSSNSNTHEGDVALMKLGQSVICGDSKSQGQESQRLRRLRGQRTCLKIERQVQHVHWRMLAPLARVLNFAYSQVVNAMLSLQEDGSISSGSHRSRSSSFSKETFVSRPASPVTNLDLLATNKSHHKREMSQVSLASTALSSESFEVLNLSELDSSNFVYVGGDSLSCDILHEYHLFPSKPSLFTQSPQPECSISMSHPSAIFTTSFPVCSPGSKDLMSSSSADFAHFDFKDLISDRHLNTLNPVVYESARGEAGAAEGRVWGLERDGRTDAADTMLDSFVVLEGDRSMLVCNTRVDDGSNRLELNGNLVGKECDLESQTSDVGSESASFSVLSESEFDGKE